MKHENPNSILFEAIGLEKQFNAPQGLRILKGLDLRIRRGEMVAVVGASGAGKTTLLHILGTLDRPTAGRLLYGGEDIFQQNDVALSAFRNRAIGFVFQLHHLLPEFTALENTMLPGLIAGKSRPRIQQDASELLTKVGLADRAGHKVGELSGGEQQRVALARALIMKPALLLADEPTGNLDPMTGDKVFALLKQLNHSLNLTTIMVTHNHELAGRVDRCLTLRDGVLVEE